MSYATVEDMIKRFGEAELVQLTDRGQTGLYDELVIKQALDDAKAEIDAYLAGRYALPLAEIPAILSRMACDIARYYLFGASVTEEVSKRYHDAVVFLKSVARGEAVVGVSKSTNAAPTVEHSPEAFGSDRTFTSHTLRDYSD